MCVLGYKETPGGATHSQRLEAAWLQQSRAAQEKETVLLRESQHMSTNESWDFFLTGSLSAGSSMLTPHSFLVADLWLLLILLSYRLRSIYCWLCSFPPMTHTPSFLFLPLSFSKVAQNRPASPTSLQVASDPWRSTPAAGQDLGRGSSSTKREGTSSLDMSRRKGCLHGLPGKMRRKPLLGVILAPGEPAHGFLCPQTSPLTPFRKLHSYTPIQRQKSP